MEKHLLTYSGHLLALLASHSAGRGLFLHVSCQIDTAVCLCVGHDCEPRKKTDELIAKMLLGGGLACVVLRNDVQCMKRVISLLVVVSSRV